MRGLSILPGESNGMLDKGDRTLVIWRCVLNANAPFRFGHGQHGGLPSSPPGLCLLARLEGG